jgi:hypothetical protein
MRTKTVVYEIFKFDELSDDAKSKARDWWREDGLAYEWHDLVYEDAKRIGAIFGITGMDIFFSGFWSQGDGACFTGDYRFKRGMSKAIREYAPLDEMLHVIADGLEAAQGTTELPLTASINRTDSHYCHEYGVTFDVEIEQEAWWDDENFVEINTGQEEAVTYQLRNFMRWIYKALEAEYNYLNSDEAVDETIECNEYEFFKDGSRANL